MKILEDEELLKEAENISMYGKKVTEMTRSELIGSIVILARLEKSTREEMLRRKAVL